MNMPKMYFETGGAVWLASILAVIVSEASLAGCAVALNGLNANSIETTRTPARKLK